jgi:signal transduction histidine kinase
VVAGIRLALPADPGFSGIIVALILAAALLGALAAAGLGSWLRSRLSVRVAAVEALPDREVPAMPPGPIRELADLDRAIRDRAARQETRRDGAGTAPADPRSSRERKALVFAGMSHDLRSPLNSVVGFTDLLLKGMDGELGQTQRASVAVIAEEAERLLVRIGDILDTARLDAGRFEIERAWVPSVEILTECATGAGRLVASKDVTFSSQLQPGLPPVRVDKSRIVQALLSLVARALEATEHGTILLEARRLPGSRGLRVEIGDPGGAVGAERRATIAQAWSIAEAGWDGFGAIGPMAAELGPAALGLSLARRMVALHGGTITTATEPADRVLFVLTLPLDAEGDEG